MISRGIAAFFGGFAILNLLGNWFAPGFDANILWIDFSPLPKAFAGAALLLGAAALLVHAIRPARGRALQFAIVAPIAFLALIALADAVRFYRLLLDHAFTTSIPFPFSALVCCVLAWIGWRVLRPSSRALTRRDRFVAAGAFAGCLIAFPLAQMFFFGNTDYRRNADVIVVFGARAHADGSPSDVLAERVRTACQLYRDGQAPLLFFSGGPGDGAIDEPQVMRHVALNLGIPDSAIRLDHDGVNTDATVRNATAFLRKSHLTHVLAVSHSYHLPRIKLSCRQAGWEVYTVPAKENLRLSTRVKFIAREVAALWAYYLHPLRR